MDFTNTKVSRLFTKLLLPTLASMFLSSIFIIVDGMMVGRGIGANALASVNMVSPLFTISTGIGLMFGIGGSILASTSLGQNNIKRAKMYAGQSILLSMLITILSILVITLFPKEVALMFATPASLMGGVIEYLIPLSFAMFFNVLLTVGLFFIRLDGAPRFAMTCVTISVVMNIALDYVFIYEYGWGLFGAAFATLLSQIVGCGMMLIYMFSFSKVIRPNFIKISKKQFSLLFQNSKKIITLGFPAFLSDIAISVMVVAGNITFINYIGDDGVAAFSVICFIFPVVFMAYNAIIHSAQPIISHNINNNIERSKEALRLSIRATVVLGFVFTICFWVYCNEIVSLFLAENTKAYIIAVDGIKWFGLGFVFYGLNILYVGYFQSIGKAKIATWFVILRGGVLTVLSFILLPMWLNDIGIWLAVPAAELITFIFALIYNTKPQQL